MVMKTSYLSSILREHLRRILDQVLHASRSRFYMPHGAGSTCLTEQVLHASRSRFSAARAMITYLPMAATRG